MDTAMTDQEPAQPVISLPDTPMEDDDVQLVEHSSLRSSPLEVAEQPVARPAQPTGPQAAAASKNAFEVLLGKVTMAM